MLTATDIATYDRDGLLVLPDLFTPTEVSALRAAFERDAKIPGEHRIAEANGADVRAVYASHHRQAEYTALTRSQRMLVPAQQLLGPELYVYQFKINAKPGVRRRLLGLAPGLRRLEDGRQPPGSCLINVAVFLDDVTEFNGPIVFIPGSHRDGTIRSGRCEQRRSEQHFDPDDIALSPEAMTGLVDRHGMVSPKGHAGTTVFFHPEIVHGSATNMSPFPRRLIIATYNETINTPRPYGEPRPEYLVCRDTRPLEVADDLILTGTAA
jgi:ectoine hydroxylase